MNHKVLHLPLEVGSQVSEMCQGLRRSGVSAVGLNWRKIDYTVDDPTLIRSDAYEMASALPELMNHFEIFHYHTGYSIFADKSDILYAHEAGKKIVMHHRGNDVRIPEIARKLNQYAYTGHSLPTADIVRSLQFFSKYVSAAIVQDYELYDYVKGYYSKVYILPRIIDTTRIKPLSIQNKNQIPLVVHIPTSQAFKGTKEIMDTVTKLQKRMSFNFKLLEQASQREALYTMAHADIVIDQVLCGAYGNISVEAMALGKPVICYLREDIYTRMQPKPPIVSANPDTLFKVLRQLISDEPMRVKRGAEGRTYAHAVHHSSKVTRQLVEIYDRLYDSH